RHEPLRTVFQDPLGLTGRQSSLLARQLAAGAWDVGLFTQEIRASADLDLDIRTVPRVRSPQFQALVNAEIGRPFAHGRAPFVRATLFRESETRHVLLVIFHHLVADGRSGAVFTRELWRNYASLIGGTAAPLAALARTYREFARSQRDR